MSTFEFDFPAERFSDARADDGVEETPRDENGNAYGTFKHRLCDVGSQRYRKDRERYFKKAAERTRDMTPFQKIVDEYVELSLIDWKGVKAGGKDIKFSKEAAVAYLNHPRMVVVMEFLWTVCHDVTRFQTVVDTEAGN